MGTYTKPPIWSSSTIYHPKVSPIPQSLPGRRAEGQAADHTQDQRQTHRRALESMLQVPMTFPRCKDHGSRYQNTYSIRKGPCKPPYVTDTQTQQILSTRDRGLTPKRCLMQKPQGGGSSSACNACVILPREPNTR